MVAALFGLMMGGSFGLFEIGFISMSLAGLGAAISVVLLYAYGQDQEDDEESA